MVADVTDRDNVVPLTKGTFQTTEDMNFRVEQARRARQSALGAAINAHDRYMEILAAQRAVLRREKGEAETGCSSAEDFVELFHHATMTKAPMLENAAPLDDVPQSANVRDGVRADRQYYKILVIGVVLAAALIARIA